jgi:FAD/FMN-containing dehydrogenase
MTAEETERVPDAYGECWGRLVELKRRYDPDNFFRFNQNIPPAAG